MKTVILSFLVLGLAGGTWTWIAPQTDPKSAAVATAPDRLTDAREQVGLRKMLTDPTGLGPNRFGDRRYWARRFARFSRADYTARSNAPNFRSGPQDLCRCPDDARLLGNRLSGG